MTPPLRRLRLHTDFVERYRRCSADPWWAAFDAPILELCETHPGHMDRNTVFAKVALMNRAYRANLQMGKFRAEWAMAVRMVGSSKAIDAAIERLHANSRFDRGALDGVLDAHALLNGLAMEATERSASSFCSKYLSFHAPEVAPIYDSRAAKLAADFTRTAEEARQSWAASFRSHCENVLQLLDVLRANGVAEPNLKFVDHVLYEGDDGDGPSYGRM